MGNYESPWGRLKLLSSDWGRKGGGPSSVGCGCLNMRSPFLTRASRYYELMLAGGRAGELNLMHDESCP